MYLHFSGSSTYFQRAFDRIKSISRYRDKWCDAAHKNGQSRRAYCEQYWMRMRNILPNILMDSCPHWQSLSNYYLAFCQIKAFQLVRNSTVMIAHYWVSSQSVVVGRSALSEQEKNKQATLANTSPISVLWQKLSRTATYLISQRHHLAANCLHHLASLVLRSSKREVRRWSNNSYINQRPDWQNARMSILLSNLALLHIH